MSKLTKTKGDVRFVLGPSSSSSGIPRSVPEEEKDSSPSRSSSRDPLLPRRPRPASFSLPPPLQVKAQSKPEYLPQDEHSELSSSPIRRRRGQSPNESPYGDQASRTDSGYRGDDEGSTRTRYQSSVSSAEERPEICQRMNNSLFCREAEEGICGCDGDCCLRGSDACLENCVVS
ncbi:hypothetical protein BDZ45DRAFT_167703 [Acephala macrosclerotiorum]|nr:hypothetical protein BDZ45DRAFT_167703 [Acephala macrosclerotiorum]